MKNRTYFLLLLYLLIISLSLQAGEYLVSSAVEIYSLINTVQPGDTITMQNDLWENQHIVFHANGTEESPILLRAETPGYVRLQGNSYLEFSGSWITVDGLMFRNGYCTSGQGVIEFRSNLGQANHCRLTNTVIADYNPSSNSTDYKWISLYGQYNRVDHCFLKGKTHSGTTLVVWLSGTPNYHRIDHNHFGERPELGVNGGETIRVGTSDWSMYDSYTIVEYNYFEHCNGETEIISNKSCENTYRYNTFYESEGTLTLRHGNRCYIYGNYFIGNKKNKTGGVRIIGEDHLVYNNYFEGLTGTGYRAALPIMCGVQNSPLNKYFQVKNAQVIFNTFANCYENMNIGEGYLDNSEGYILTLPPENCTIANNIIYSDGSKDVVQQPVEPINIFWQGNIFYGNDLGIDVPAGITWQNPDLVLADGGLYRPSAMSPTIGAAVGDYSQVTTDFDGQLRSAPFDVGCDEHSSEPVLITPLSEEDVGVNWYFSKPVAVEIFAGENTLSEALSILGLEDTLKLVTDGGIYQLSEKFIVDRKIIIRAAEGLSEKPIITRSGSVTNGSVLFELQGLGELYLRGVVLDGGADSENLLSALIASAKTPFPEYFRIITEDCDLTAVQNSGSGSFLKFYPGTKADSVVFKNCLFSDCDGIGLQMNSESENSGMYNVSNLVIQNSTFWRIDQEAISVYAGDNIPFSIGPKIDINHCTFDHCGISGTPIVHFKEVDTAVISNSIFSNSSIDTAAVIIYGWSFIEYCDIFNAGSVVLERGAHQYEGMISFDPKYVNEVAGDFTLAYSSPVRGIANDGEALGDLRWAGDVGNSIEFTEQVMVEEFTLYQNYPNPFNGETRISYTLLKAATIELQIYNLNGTRVAQWKMTHATSGNYSVNWKPDFAASGVYICQLIDDGKSKMIKMMFVK